MSNAAHATMEKARELPPIPQRILDSLGTPEKVAAAEKLWERLVPMAPEFAVAISNPPYQEITSTNGDGNSTVTNIFHRFQLGSMEIAEATSMIYPGARWIQRSGKGLNEFGRALVNDPRLVSVDYFSREATERLFPSIGITDGVSVVHWSRKHGGDTFSLNGVQVKHPGDEVLPVDAALLPLLEKIRSKGLPSLHGSITSRSLFGVESDFVEKNPGKIALVVEGKKAPARFKDPIKVLTNDKAGKSGRPRLYWLERSDLPRGHGHLDKWKFVVKSAQFAHETTQIKNAVVLDNKTAHGRAKVALKMFATEEEVRNFSHAMRTPLFTTLYRGSIGGGLSHLGDYVPDLEDYTGSNPLFMEDEAMGVEHEYHGLSLEERLVKYFSLTEDELSAVKGD